MKLDNENDFATMFLVMADRAEELGFKEGAEFLRVQHDDIVTKHHSPSEMCGQWLKKKYYGWVESTAKTIIEELVEEAPDHDIEGWIQERVEGAVEDRSSMFAVRETLFCSDNPFFVEENEDQPELSLSDIAFLSVIEDINAWIFYAGVTDGDPGEWLEEHLNEEDDEVEEDDE